MQMRRLLLLTALIAALWAARCPAWAEDAVLRVGQLISVDLSRGEQRFQLIPESSGVCDICAFPAEGFEGSVSAELYRGGERVAAGEGSLTLIAESLTAGEMYALRLRGTGRIWLEIARHAMSRCFDDAKALDADGDEYSKAVARAGDAHWYAVRAGQSQPIMLSGLPRAPGLRLEARLFSESGRMLAEATRTAGGAFLMDFMPRAGRTYRIRVSAPEDGVGLYDLWLTPGSGGLPEAVLLDPTSLALYGQETRALSVSVTPEGAAGVMLWESSDPGVAEVRQDGAVTGRQPGSAVITAYAAGAVRARCRVDVHRAAVRDVNLITSRIHMNAGDDLALEWNIVPESATDPGVTFEVHPEGVVTVDEAGVLRALDVGEAAITIRTRDGGYEDYGVVSVSPARRRYRALLVGEQNYAPEAAAVRLGSANSVAGMRSMLGGLNFQGSRFEITTALDISRGEVLTAIEDAFAGATDQDAALFYITCHGDYAHGMTRFQLYDGSVLTAQELRQALDRVPGEIILLLDCCGSGGAIGRAASPAEIMAGVTRVFGGAMGPDLFGSSRYRVLASAMVGQDSYRISFDSQAQESSMATLFARAVCEGCGWNIDAASRQAMRADTNYDGVVSLYELFRYARARVMWYLSLTGSGYAQIVTVSPEGDVRPLFERAAVRRDE